MRRTDSDSGESFPLFSTKSQINSSNLSADGITFANDSDAEEDSESSDFTLTDTSKTQDASAKSALFNLVNNIIGGGVLALPFAFYCTGLILGIILLIIVGVLSAYSAQLLLQASRPVADKTFTGVMRATLGDKGAVISDLAMVIFIFGALTGYMIIIGDVLSPFIDFLPGALSYRGAIAGLVTVLVLTPLCLLYRVDSLKYTSVMALVCIAYMVIVIIIRSSQQIVDDGVDDDDLRLFHFAFSIFQAIPIMSFAFTFHPNLFPIFTEMENPNRTRMYRVVRVGMTICGIAYLAVGIFGYLSFLSDVEGNIFNNYDDDVVVDIAKVALGILIMFSYPLLHYPGRVALDSVIVKMFDEDKIIDYVKYRHFIEAAFLIMVSYLLSVALPDISVVFGFSGATAGNLIVFIGPSYAYIKLRPGKLMSFQKICAGLLLFAGIFSGTISVIVILVDVLSS